MRASACAELAGVAAHFIKRDQPVVGVEHRVLKALCHDRARDLLKAHGKLKPFILFLIMIFIRVVKRQDKSKGVKDRSGQVAAELAGLGCPALHKGLDARLRIVGRYLVNLGQAALPTS